MPETIVTPASTSIVQTPVAAPVAPESALYPTTPGAAPSAVVPASATPPANTVVTPTVTPPAAPTEPAKVPTEPIKPEVQTTPATPPTDYTLVLPEGSLLSAEKQATLVKEAKAAGLSKEEAQEVLNSHEAVAKDTATAARAQVVAEQTKAMADAKVLWKSEVEKDPELGGANLAQTAILSSRGYQAATTPEDRKFIESLGLDHHPTFVRMMAKFGKLIGEDPRLILGQVGGAPVQRDSASVLYGKTTPDGTGKITG